MTNEQITEKGSSNQKNTNTNRYNYNNKITSVRFVPAVFYFIYSFVVFFLRFEIELTQKFVS